MRINKLHLKNFKSYKDCRLDLSEVHACSIVGGNGSGKSTIAEAMIWGLFGYTKFPSARELMHPGSKVMSVEMSFTMDGHDYDVVRTYDGSMTATGAVDGQSMSQYASGITPAIVKALGISRELIAESVIVQQGQLASFVNATPSERRDLIMLMLGMDKYQKAWETAKDAHKSLLGTVNSHDISLTTIETQLNNIPDKYAIEDAISVISGDTAISLGKITNLVNQEATLKAKMDQAQGAIGEWNNRALTLKVKLADINDEFNTRIDSLRKELENDMEVTSVSYHLDIERFNKELAEAHSMIGSIQSIKGRIDSCKSQITTQRTKIDVASKAADMCPLCGTKLTAEKWQEILVGMQQELTTSISDLNTAQGELDRAPLPRDTKHISDDIVKSSSQLEWAKGLEKDIPRLTKKLEDTINDKDCVVNGVSIELQEVMRKITDLQGLFDAETALQLQRITAELQLLRDNHTKLVVELTDWSAQKKSREALEHSLTDVSSMLKLAKDKLPEIEFVASALSPNGVPIMLIDHYLPLVESRMKELLYLMSDGVLGVKLIVDGKKVELLAGSGQLRPIKSLSGGEQTRVSLALRLALSQVLFEIANCKFDCLLIDEPEYLDESGVSQFINAISNLRNMFSQIFVISHLPAVRNAFPKYILVEKDQDVSTAILVA